MIIHQMPFISMRSRSRSLIAAYVCCHAQAVIQRHTRLRRPRRGINACCFFFYRHVDYSKILCYAYMRFRCYCLRHYYGRHYMNYAIDTRSGCLPRHMPPPCHSYHYYIHIIKYITYYFAFHMPLSVISLPRCYFTYLLPHIINIHYHFHITHYISYHYHIFHITIATSPLRFSELRLPIITPSDISPFMPASPRLAATYLLTLYLFYSILHAMPATIIFYAILFHYAISYYLIHTPPPCHKFTPPSLLLLTPYAMPLLFTPFILLYFFAIIFRHYYFHCHFHFLRCCHFLPLPLR